MILVGLMFVLLEEYQSLELEMEIEPAVFVQGIDILLL